MFDQTNGLQPKSEYIVFNCSHRKKIQCIVYLMHSREFLKRWTWIWYHFSLVLVLATTFIWIQLWWFHGMKSNIATISDKKKTYNSRQNDIYMSHSKSTHEKKRILMQFNCNATWKIILHLIVICFRVDFRTKYYVLHLFESKKKLCLKIMRTF